MGFWSAEIRAADVREPIEIMQDAADELTAYNDMLAVTIPHTELTDRIVYAFNVTNAARMTQKLFEVTARKEEPYPAVINPQTVELPEFLKKRRYVPGNYDTGCEPDDGYYVDNEWVCVTPAEFKAKLEQLLAEDHIKSRVLSLIAASRRTPKTE